MTDLSKYGFIYIGLCHCDGLKTDKYKKGDTEIRIRRNRYIFRIKEAGVYKTEWLPLTELPKYVQNVAVQA